MMAALFLLWAVAVAVAWSGRRAAAMALGAVTVALSVAMLIHHITSSIDINL